MYIEAAAPERKGGDYWIDAITTAREREQSWRERARKVIDRYRDERPYNEDETRINILWANTDVLSAALYQHTPKPDIRRRFGTADAPARLAALAMERMLSYSVDQYHFDAVIRDALSDYLLTGRGVVRVRYDHDTETRKTMIAALDDDGLVVEKSVSEDEIVDQRFQCEPVAWSDLILGPARCWREVEWIAFRHYLDQDQLEAQFGSAGKDVELTHTAEGRERDYDDDSTAKRGVIFEIFDKRNRRVLFVANDGSVLADDDDPYGLQDFYPIPEPLYYTRTTDSMVPIPFFTLIQDQVFELDLVSGRIAVLTEALKRRGVYDASMDGLGRLADAGDNEFVPIDAYQALLEKGGLSSVMAEAPIANLVNVLQTLQAARQSIIEIIYEMLGISDIMRGVSADRETATTSRAKSFFGSLRLINQKREVTRFVRDVFRLKAELIAEHIDPGVLMAATQVMLDESAIALLRDEMQRNYRLDVESDDSVLQDQVAEQEARTQAMQVAGGVIAQVSPLVESGVMPFEAAKALVGFGLGAFKKTREIEEFLNALQPPTPQEAPEQNPEAQLAIVEKEARAVEAQMSAQIEQLRTQVKMRDLELKSLEIDLKAARQDDDLEIAQQKLALQAEKNEMDADVAIARERTRLSELDQDRDLKTRELDLRQREMEQNNHG